MKNEKKETKAATVEKKYPYKENGITYVDPETVPCKDWHKTISDQAVELILSW